MAAPGAVTRARVTVDGGEAVALWWPASTRRQSATLRAAVFHHGTLLGPADYDGLCACLALRGFVVVARRFYVGVRGLFAWGSEVKSARELHLWAAKELPTGLSTDDGETVPATIDVNAGLVLVGHSRGAAVALLAARMSEGEGGDHDPITIAAVVALDPVDADAAPLGAGRGFSLLGADAPLEHLERVPRVLVMASEMQDGRSAPEGRSYQAFVDALRRSKVGTECAFRRIEGAGHVSFCDERVRAFPFVTRGGAERSSVWETVADAVAGTAMAAGAL